MTWFILSILSVFVLAGAELMQQHLLSVKNGFNSRGLDIFCIIFLLSLPIAMVEKWDG